MESYLVIRIRILKVYIHMVVRWGEFGLLCGLDRSTFFLYDFIFIYLFICFSSCICLFVCPFIKVIVFVFDIFLYACVHADVGGELTSLVSVLCWLLLFLPSRLFEQE